MTFRSFLLSTVNHRPIIAQTFLQLAIAEIGVAALTIWHTARHRLPPSPAGGLPVTLGEPANDS